MFGLLLLVLVTGLIYWFIPPVWKLSNSDFKVTVYYDNESGKPIENILIREYSCSISSIDRPENPLMIDIRLVSPGLSDEAFTSEPESVTAREIFFRMTSDPSLSLSW